MEESTISDKELQQLQAVLLDMAKVVKKICDEEHIKYYILGGTFLGAVRHKGFIPWDDDFDIVMPREDYNRFLQIVKDKLPEGLDLWHYSIKKYENEKFYAHFAKIINLKCNIYTKNNNQEYKRNVFVDIIPLDGMPEGIIKKAIFKLKVFIKLQQMRISTIREPKYFPEGYKGKNIIKRLLYIIYSKGIIHTNKTTLQNLKEFDELLSTYSYDDAKYVSNILGGNGLFKETFLKKDIGQGKAYKFEDTEFIGAENYDAVLSHMYGNTYNQLPPEKERKCKHCVKIEIID